MTPALCSFSGRRVAGMGPTPSSTDVGPEQHEAVQESGGVSQSIQERKDSHDFRQGWCNSTS